MPVGDNVLQALLGQRDRDSEKDGMMIRYSQAQALQMGGGDTSGAN